VRPRHVSGVHAHWPAEQTKFSLPVPLGQPQLTVVHPLVTFPHALPSAGTGHVAAAQQTFGFGVVLHARPPVHEQVSVPPQPLLYVPQASPPGWPGPPGTLLQVYGWPVGLLHWQVPVMPGVVTEHVWPVGQPQASVPPVPLSRPVPHLPA
jgi:hypothetical protein